MQMQFNTKFLLFKVVLINMVAILMMSAELAALGLRKLKLFWNNGYDIKTFVHDVNNIVLLRDLK